MQKRIGHCNISIKIIRVAAALICLNRGEICVRKITVSFIAAEKRAGLDNSDQLGVQKRMAKRNRARFWFFCLIRGSNKGKSPTKVGESFVFFEPSIGSGWKFQQL